MTPTATRWSSSPRRSDRLRGPLGEMTGERGPTREADRLTIARALREMAGLLDASGQETFKARAYARGADVLERLDADLGELVARRRLTTLPGIGPALAAMITELYQTGRSQALEAQRQRVPAVALELSRIPRLGLDKIAALNAALGVKTLDDLEAACVAGRVRSVKGMGEKTERRILEEIRRLRAPEAQRVLLPEALAIADVMRAHLDKSPGSAGAEAAGELRRWAESVGELSLVVATDRPAEAMKHALRAPLLSEVTSREKEGFHGRLASSLPVRVQIGTLAGGGDGPPGRSDEARPPRALAQRGDVTREGRLPRASGQQSTGASSDRVPRRVCAGALAGDWRGGSRGAPGTAGPRARRAPRGRERSRDLQPARTALHPARAPGG